MKVDIDLQWLRENYGGEFSDKSIRHDTGGSMQLFPLTRLSRFTTHDKRQVQDALLNWIITRKNLSLEFFF